MSDRNVPYFMKNKDWYYWDEKAERFKLTNKAPKEAIESYNEWYSEEEIYVDENGKAWIIE